MRFISKFEEYGLTMESSESFVERGRTITKAGKHINFHNNQYSTTDQKEIAWLRKHQDFNKDFYALKEEPMDKKVVVLNQLKADDQSIK